MSQSASHGQSCVCARARAVCMHVRVARVRSRVCLGAHMLVHARVCAALGRNGAAWGSGEAPTVFANGMSMGSAPAFGADSPPPTTSMLIFEAREVCVALVAQGPSHAEQGGNRGQHCVSKVIR